MHGTGPSERRGAERIRVSVLRRLLAAMLAAAQLLLASSPLLDRDAGEIAVAHVEEQGVQLHWSHDMAECAACAYRLLGATPPAEPVALIAVPVHAQPEPTRLAAASDDPHLSSRYSRAPPTVT